MSGLDEQMAALRALLYEAPSSAVWEEVCRLFDAWPPGSAGVGVSYAEEHMQAAGWPVELRRPPQPWREAAQRGEAPAGWPLVCGAELILEQTGRNKIAVIRDIRMAVGCGLKEAKDLSERPPVVLLECVGYAEAWEAKAQLEASGAVARVVGTRVGWGPQRGEASAEEYDIWVDEAPNERGAAHALRDAFGVSVAEAQHRLRGFPARVAQRVTWLDAQRLVRALEESGASARAEVWSRAEPTRDARVRLGGVGPHKLQVIKALREQLRLGLAEAKGLAEAAPCVVAEGLTVTEADALVRALRQVQAEAEVER